MMANSVQLKSVRPWHEQIVDWMLQNPHKTQGECADHFDKTQPWLSSVINSDIFRDYKSLRFTQHQDMVSHSVITRVSGLADLSLEVLHERIAEERNDIPLGIVKDSAELTLKALGFGPKPHAAHAATTITLNVGAASPDVLASARDDLRRLHTENTTSEVDVEDAEEVVTKALETVSREVVDGSSTPAAKPQLPLLGEI